MFPEQFYLCRRSRSDVKSRYSETLRPVMSTRMSPVTTFMRGGRPPTPLGQEKPVPCIEQVQRTGSWMDNGRVGGDVTGSEKTIESGIIPMGLYPPLNGMQPSLMLFNTSMLFLLWMVNGLYLFSTFTTFEWGNLGFSILPRDTSPCWTGEMGNELSTFWLVDDWLYLLLCYG